MCGGDFKVWREEDIPMIAYQWIKKMKMETGFRPTIIEKVIWNNEKDITEQVLKIVQAPLPSDDLPF
ncbi:MAG: hypothetical protein AB2401_05745 [Bacillus sp. (in: firmicutes)]|uniref:hypothetical protein n=1 Tax=Bacillus marasmi TaxID=1926279 RepID=UPI001FE4ACE8|nr:hypothetical protein [Bacillus marasmi]